MARLDRFPTVEEVVQLGAALGREFTHELLKTLPHFLERTQQELMLQMTLAAPLVMTKGHPPQS